MEDQKKEYEKLVQERNKISEQIKALEETEAIKKYLNLSQISKELTEKLNALYESIKKEEYKTCSHIWVTVCHDRDGWEGRSYDYEGCIKCGLDRSVLKTQRRFVGLLSRDERIMYDILQNHYFGGINADRLCDLNLGKAIYSKIKEACPGIDDETAVKYFKIALDNIRKNKTDECERTNCAKRLSLSPNFNRWNGLDVSSYL